VSPLGAAVLPGGCDYSTALLATLNEPSLDECLGFDGGTLGFGPSDWDADGTLEGVTNCRPPNAANSSAELNGDNLCVGAGPNGILQSAVNGADVNPAGSSQILDGADFTCNSTAVPDDTQNRAVGGVEPPLTGFDDWNSVRFAFQDLPTFANGVSSPTPADADPDDLARARRQTSTVLHPIVSVQVTAPPTILPGQQLSFGVHLASIGRGPALEATWLNQDPAGAQVSTLLGAVRVGEVRDLVTTFTVPANACPTTLVDTATIDFEDVVGEVSTATGVGSSRVLDIVPPALSVAVSPTVLTPPNHKLVPIAPSITVSDNCDPSPTVLLVGITSSESANGTGDGNTSNDIVVDAAGQISLRAERSGNGPGRTYTLTYRATDASGNATTATATVSVPKGN
jgi:hypothetical protein